MAGQQLRENLGYETLSFVWNIRAQHFVAVFVVVENG
jgi:hypothetical protein